MTDAGAKAHNSAVCPFVPTHMAADSLTWKGTRVACREKRFVYTSVPRSSVYCEMLYSMVEVMPLRAGLGAHLLGQGASHSLLIPIPTFGRSHLSLLKTVQHSLLCLTGVHQRNEQAALNLISVLIYMQVTS